MYFKQSTNERFCGLLLFSFVAVGLNLTFLQDCDMIYSLFEMRWTSEKGIIIFMRITCYADWL